MANSLSLAHTYVVIAWVEHELLLAHCHTAVRVGEPVVSLLRGQKELLVAVHVVVGLARVLLRALPLLLQLALQRDLLVVHRLVVQHQLLRNEPRNSDNVWSVSRVYRQTSGNNAETFNLTCYVVVSPYQVDKYQIFPPQRIRYLFIQYNNCSCHIIVHMHC